YDYTWEQITNIKNGKQICVGYDGRGRCNKWDYEKIYETKTIAGTRSAENGNPEQVTLNDSSSSTNVPGLENRFYQCPVTGVRGRDPNPKYVTPSGTDSYNASCNFARTDIGYLTNSTS